MKIVRMLSILLVVLMATGIESHAQITFDASGNIGIGTDAPTATLGVAGTVETDTLSIDGAAGTATADELNHVDGVTGPIQPQIDAKADLDSLIFTGSVTFPGIGTWQDSGAVGVEVDTPSVKLHVHGGNLKITPADPVNVGHIDEPVPGG